MIKKYLKQTLIINCLAVISSDYALKKDENYYPQVFLIECKDIVKGIIWHITEDLENSYDESDKPDKE